MVGCNAHKVTFQDESVFTWLCMWAGRQTGATKDGDPTESGAPPASLLLESSSGVTQVLLQTLSYLGLVSAGISLLPFLIVPLNLAGGFPGDLEVTVGSLLHWACYVSPCLCLDLAPRRDTMIVTLLRLNLKYQFCLFHETGQGGDTEWRLNGDPCFYSHVAVFLLFLKSLDKCDLKNLYTFSFHENGIFRKFKMS